MSLRIRRLAVAAVVLVATAWAFPFPAPAARDAKVPGALHKAERPATGWGSKAAPAWPRLDSVRKEPGWRWRLAEAAVDGETVPAKLDLRTDLGALTGAVGSHAVDACTLGTVPRWGAVDGSLRVDGVARPARAERQGGRLTVAAGNLTLRFEQSRRSPSNGS